MKILITGAWRASEEQLQKIASLGHEIIRHQQEQEHLPVPYESVEGVICNGLFLAVEPIEINTGAYSNQYSRCDQILFPNFHRDPPFR